MRWPLVAKAAITVGIAWYVLKLVPLASVGRELQNASAAWVAAGVAVQLLVRVVNAQRIRIIALAQSAPLGYRAILATLFTTAFYGLMLPGNIAAGAATLVKYVGQGASIAASLASMLVNRLLETLTVVSLGLSFFAMDRRSGHAPIPDWTGAVALAGAVLLVAGHLVLFGRVRALDWVAGLARRFRLDTRGRALRSISNVLEQCARAANLKPLAAIVVCCLSVLKELLAVAVAFCFARAVGVDLSFVTIAWMQAVTALVLLLPLTVSGLGVREGGLALMTHSYGVAPADAVAWGLLQFVGLLCMATIGGLLEARVLWRSPAKPQ